MSRPPLPSPQGTKVKGKPVDLWLGFAAVAAGIVYYLLSKSPSVIVISLALICALLIHPIWNFWWIEKRNWRRVLAYLVLLFGVVYLGWVAWPAPEAVPKEQAVRLKYSSTQTIEISNTPGRYNDELNLDNVAALIQIGEANRDAIRMGLVASPPIRADNPKRGETFDAGGDIKVHLGEDKVLEFRNSIVLRTKEEFVFHRFKSPACIVKVRDRTFIISLQSIRDASKEKQKLLVYTFGISEQ